MDHKPCTPAVCDAVERYRLHLERKRSRLTVVGYLQDLHQLIRWLAPEVGGVVDLCHLTQPLVLQKWIDAMRKKGRTAATIGRRVHGLRAFVRMLVAEGQLDRDVSAQLELPRGRRRLPAFLSHDQVQQLLAAPMEHAPPEVRARDLAILELLYASAIRRAECAALNLDDIRMDAAAKEVMIFVAAGKGDKEGWVPCGPVVYAALDRYLKLRNQLLDGVGDGANQKALFLSLRRRRLSASRLYQLVHVYGVKVGVPAWPHLLRHTCATHMHGAGADIRQVQAHLRHDDIRTTARYAHCNVAQMRAAAARFHPRFAPAEPSPAALAPPAAPPDLALPARRFLADMFSWMAGVVTGPAPPLPLP